MWNIFSLIFWAFTIRRSYSALDEEYTARVTARGLKTTSSIYALSKCLVDDAMVNRLIAEPQTAENAKIHRKQKAKLEGEGSEYTYIISGTLVQLNRLHTLCDNAKWQITIKIVGNSHPFENFYLPNPQTVTPLQQNKDVPPRLNSHCFIHTVSGHCVRCLARHAGGWEFMSSQIFVHLHYTTRVVLTVIFTGLKTSEEAVNGCDVSNCSRKLYVLKAEVCSQLARERIQEIAANAKATPASESTTQPKTKRKSVSSTKNDAEKRIRKKGRVTSSLQSGEHHGIHLTGSHQKKKAGKVQTLLEVTNSINKSVKPLSTTTCIKLEYRLAEMIYCIKSILEKISATIGVVLGQHLSDTKAILLLHGEWSTLLEQQSIVGGGDRNPTCLAEILETSVCRSISIEMLEYPIQRQDTMQNQSTCIAAEYSESGRNSCFRTIQDELDKYYKYRISDKSSLVLVKSVQASNLQVREEGHSDPVVGIMKKSRLQSHKCSFSVLSPEICILHEEILKVQGWDINEDPPLEITVDTATTSDKPALWPPCADVPEEAIRDPLKRFFVAVQLSISSKTGSADNCLDCIVKLLEVFFINNNESRYLWMTQVLLEDVQKCVKGMCDVKGVRYRCMKNPPSKNPLAILSDDLEDRLKQNMLEKNPLPTVLNE